MFKLRLKCLKALSISKLNNVDSKYAKQATEGKNSNVVELLNRMAKAVLVNG